MFSSLSALRLLQIQQLLQLLKLKSKFLIALMLAVTEPSFFFLSIIFFLNSHHGAKRLDIIGPSAIHTVVGTTSSMNR